MKRDFVYGLLERKYREYNKAAFIADDPISIPHRFSKKQDIEIMGFWTAMLSWGNRKSIMSSANKLVQLMDGAPHDFMLNHVEKDLKRFLEFKHRTFNATDTLYFIEFFKQFYKEHESLEEAFIDNTGIGKSLVRKEENGKITETENIESILSHFHETFFSLEDSPHRTRKHIATPLRNSACKRMNMFLRWMVRKDKQGVDFGLWTRIKPSQLLCPLDIHVDRVARKLGLLRRKQTDWQAVIELTENLKTFDPKDPVKYDFALFGIGNNEYDNVTM